MNKIKLLKLGVSEAKRQDYKVSYSIVVNVIKSINFKEINDIKNINKRKSELSKLLYKFLLKEGDFLKEKVLTAPREMS